MMRFWEIGIVLTLFAQVAAEEFASAGYEDLNEYADEEYGSEPEHREEAPEIPELLFTLSNGRQYPMVGVGVGNLDHGELSLSMKFFLFLW